MVFDLYATTSNIPQSSTSSCTEYFIEASNKCSPNCCHHRCCGNSLINEYTYSKIKKICRKIIKDINRQRCREKYTIFDGGNSVNVRIHRSSSADKSLQQSKHKLSIAESKNIPGKSSKNQISSDKRDTLTAEGAVRTKLGGKDSKQKRRSTGGTSILLDKVGSLSERRGEFDPKAKARDKKMKSLDDMTAAQQSKDRDKRSKKTYENEKEEDLGLKDRKGRKKSDIYQAEGDVRSKDRGGKKGKKKTDEYDSDEDLRLKDGSRKKSKRKSDGYDPEDRSGKKGKKKSDIYQAEGDVRLKDRGGKKGKKQADEYDSDEDLPFKERDGRRGKKKSDIYQAEGEVYLKGHGGKKGKKQADEYDSAEDLRLKDGSRKKSKRKSDEYDAEDRSGKKDKKKSDIYQAEGEVRLKDRGGKKGKKQDEEYNSAEDLRLKDDSRKKSKRKSNEYVPEDRSGKKGQKKSDIYHADEDVRSMDRVEKKSKTKSEDYENGKDLSSRKRGSKKGKKMDGKLKSLSVDNDDGLDKDKTGSKPKRKRSKLTESGIALERSKQSKNNSVDAYPMVSDLRNKVRKGYDVLPDNKQKKSGGIVDVRYTASYSDRHKSRKNASFDSRAHGSKTVHDKMRNSKSEGIKKRSLPYGVGSQRLTKDKKDRLNERFSSKDGSKLKVRKSASARGGVRNGNVDVYRRSYASESISRRFVTPSRFDEERPCDYLRAHMEQRELCSGLARFNICGCSTSQDCGSPCNMPVPFEQPNVSCVC